MKIKMLNSILCTIFCITLLNMQVNCVEKEDAQNWYLKYNSNGIRPDTPDNGEYTEKYNAISIDKSGEKTIYLTFDAGYENGNINKILDILKRQNVNGAFFILPNLIKTNPEIVKRMNDEGHLICNHTRSHKNMAYVNNFDEFKKELTDLEEILFDKLGIEIAKYYRPPEGAYSEVNLEYANFLGYRTVFWSLAYADWDNSKQMNPSNAISLLLSRIHPGCVLLLHPTSDTNAQILEEFITKLKEDGYTFKSLDDFPSSDIQ